mgnify:CR=1 FL=1
MKQTKPTKAVVEACKNPAGVTVEFDKVAHTCNTREEAIQVALYARKAYEKALAEIAALQARLDEAGEAVEVELASSL